MIVVAVVQARMGSSRLPGKVLKPIAGRPMIDVLLSRLARSKLVDKIVVATTDTVKDDALADCVNGLGFEVVRGSETDVLDRYVKAAKETYADVLVRITGDCPLVDADLVDRCVQGYLESNVDYFSNIEPPTFPDGLDIEVFSAEALLKSALATSDSYDHEHVTPYLRRSDQVTRANHFNGEDLSHLRWTVDEPADYEVISAIFGQFEDPIEFTWSDVLDLHRKMPQLFEANRNFVRGSGEKMSSGQKLYKRAKQLIPGGNMLLSKRPEMFLPEHWPSYFSKAKGCQVWDMDDQVYTDMSIMGIGTNTLGYGHPEVDAAVQEVVSKGNMATFNCPEEVLLAERLVEMHPWADMVRFARSGGEINAVSIRIARAASGKSGVAFCGYHGWHDWYLSANLAEDANLNGHLLPGLEPNGVPQDLAGSVHPFAYNDLAALTKIVEEKDIGVIKMEVSRNMGPEPGYLEGVRALADQHNIVLIFDECTSGFRETFGGLHKKYGVEPDMMILGKALGNGYAITACLGREAVMQAAQTTFISSTFWTERIGPAAALKTLDVMQATKSWEFITAQGLKVRQGWQDLADKHDLEISHWGLPSLTGFTFESSSARAYKTLITQEMLKKGYLAANSVYVCVEHTNERLGAFFDALDPVFASIKECEDGRDIETMLDGPVCHVGFSRLN